MKRLKLFKTSSGLAVSLMLVTSLSSVPAFVYAEEISMDDLKNETADENLLEGVVSKEVIIDSDLSLENKVNNILEDKEFLVDDLSQDSQTTYVNQDNLGSFEDNNQTVNDLNKPEDNNQIDDVLNKPEDNNQIDDVLNKPEDNNQSNNEVSFHDEYKRDLNNNEQVFGTDSNEKSKAIEITQTIKSSSSNNSQVIDLQDEKQIVDTEDGADEYKVSVIINKVDDDGKMLKGATLQIIDCNGNVVDEWVSDGSSHEIMLPEGSYVLHEKNTPLGYEVAGDRSFNVSVSISEINADVDHDDSRAVCWHYGGVALYYVESKGEKQEVYCINQGWDEPDNTCYNGTVLTSDNITNFTPDMDDTLSSKELYDKMLDIIYHRSKASSMFPELSETEIRYVTEFALKNYTSAKILEGDNTTLQYRDYRYDSNVLQGFVKESGKGDAIGQLAKHWWYYHGRQKLPSKYAELFYYLIGVDDPHPEDMYIYIYTAKEITLSGEKYQNLLGVRWFNSYDDDYRINLDYVNKFKEIKKTDALESKKTDVLDESKNVDILKETNNITDEPKKVIALKKEKIFSKDLNNFEQIVNKSETLEKYVELREYLKEQIPKTADETDYTKAISGAVLGCMSFIGSAFVKKKKLV